MGASALLLSLLALPANAGGAVAAAQAAPRSAVRVIAVPAGAKLAPLGGATSLPAWSGLKGGMLGLSGAAPGLGSVMNFAPEGAAPETPVDLPAPAAEPRPAEITGAAAALLKPMIPGGPTLGRAGGVLRAADAADAPLVPSPAPAPGGAAATAFDPEAAAAPGRALFDQDAERGVLIDSRPGGIGFSPAAAASVKPLAEGGIPAAPASRAGGAAAWRPGDAFERGPDASGLRDAVASPVPGAAAAAPLKAAPAPAGFSVFRTDKAFVASPNGALPGAAAPAPRPAPLVPGDADAPRPLSLSLSGSGLVVRVRSALEKAPSAGLAPLPSPRRRPAPGASTAFLERAGLLEAVSAAEAAAGLLTGPSLAAGPSAPDAPISASRGASSRRALDRAGAFWMLFALPLAAAAGARRL